MFNGLTSTKQVRDLNCCATNISICYVKSKICWWDKTNFDYCRLCENEELRVYQEPTFSFLCFIGIEARRICSSKGNVVYCRKCWKF